MILRFIRKLWRRFAGTLKVWHRPVIRRYPKLERGSQVLWCGELYVIYDEEPNIRVPSARDGGPCCYLALNSAGAIVSLTNWNCEKL